MRTLKITIDKEEAKMIREDAEERSLEEAESILQGVTSIYVDGKIKHNFENMTFGVTAEVNPDIGLRKTVAALINEVCYYNAYQKKILESRENK